MLTASALTFLLHLLTAACIVDGAFEMSWESAASLPAEGRHHPITFANETHGFLLTGSTPSQTFTNDFYMYDEAADQWVDLSSTSSAFPGAPRSFGYGVVLNEADHPKAYLGFGVSFDGTPLADWWEFDMTTHAWTRLADFAGPGRRHPAMNAVMIQEQEWEIHVGLGDGLGGNYDDWWSYSIASDSWSRLPDFPGSARHHPFYFAIGSSSYAGLGHSSGFSPLIERDWYRFEDGTWQRELDFASYNDENVLVSTEARVAGTQFSIVLPMLTSAIERSSNSLSGSLGFVLSGDGDDHDSMETGEFHVFYPGTPGSWRELPPHPKKSRWAPGSFVMRGTARAYFTCGYDRFEGILYNDLWKIDLSELFVEDTTISPEGTLPPAGGPAPLGDVPSSSAASCSFSSVQTCVILAAAAANLLFMQ